MAQKIGERELALREMRERNAKAAKPTREVLAAKLSVPSGQKPIKRKVKRGGMRAIE